MLTDYGLIPYRPVSFTLTRFYRYSRAHRTPFFYYVLLLYVLAFVNMLCGSIEAAQVES
jgi:uncharacterized membrane protein YhaH (DUF805 family)